MRVLSAHRNYAYTVMDSKWFEFGERFEISADRGYASEYSKLRRCMDTGLRT